MSKPSVVALPLTLMLFDYWPLGRLSTRNMKAFLASRNAALLILEKVPFLVLALAGSVAAFVAQRQLGAVTPVELLGRSERVDNAIMAYALYVIKMFWPTNLSIIYTHSGVWPFGHVAIAGSAILAATLASWHYRRSLPYIFVGWNWFLGTLIPMIGFVQVGAQFMADRYTYVSYIGLFMIVSWGLADLWRCLRIPKKAAFGLVAGTLCVLTLVTRHQLSFWADSLTLFEHATSVTKGNWLVHHDFALALSSVGKYGRAEEEFLIAEQIAPRENAIRNSHAKFYLQLGYLERALDLSSNLMMADPINVEAAKRLALIYAVSDKPEYRNKEMALKYARLVCVESPELKPEHYDILAAAYAEGGNFDAAIVAEERAVALAEGTDSQVLQEHLALFRSGKPYRTDFGAPKHRAISFSFATRSKLSEGAAARRK